jgi:hypothetical protein
MSQRNLKPLTFEQFLAWERGQELKHEFVDGEAIGMAGGTEAHSVIQANLIAAAAPKLRGSGCRPFTSDMLVRTGTDRGRYPDMTIDCGERRAQNLVAPEPKVVFEVLSEDTQQRDRTIKLADYNATPSIDRPLRAGRTGRAARARLQPRSAWRLQSSSAGSQRIGRNGRSAGHQPVPDDERNPRRPRA